MKKLGFTVLKKSVADFKKRKTKKEKQKKFVTQVTQLKNDIKNE
jgi:hypothetical protein